MWVYPDHLGHLPEVPPPAGPPEPGSVRGSRLRFGVGTGLSRRECRELHRRPLGGIARSGRSGVRPSAFRRGSPGRLRALGKAQDRPAPAAADGRRPHRGGARPRRPGDRVGLAHRRPVAGPSPRGAPDPRALDAGSHRTLAGQGRDDASRSPLAPRPARGLRRDRPLRQHRRRRRHPDGPEPRRRGSRLPDGSQRPGAARRDRCGDAGLSEGAPRSLSTSFRSRPGCRTASASGGSWRASAGPSRTRATCCSNRSRPTT